MFKLQSLFETCPKNGTVSFQLSIPFSGLDDRYQAFAYLPDGSIVNLPVTDGCAIIERIEGPGLHRFDIRIADAGNRESVLEWNYIDVVILEECADEVRKEFDKAISSVRASSIGTVEDRVKKAVESLHQITKGAELPEVLRQIWCKTGDAFSLWCNLQVVQSFLDRLTTKPFFGVIAETATEVLSTVVDPNLLRTAYDILDRIPLRPDEKWFYFLRTLTDADKAADGQVNLAVSQLATITPKKIRPTVLQVAERLCETRLYKVPHVARLFGSWNYKEGIPFLLGALEMNVGLSGPVCSVIQACNYREAMPTLRELLPVVPMSNGGIAIAQLLGSWKDTESLELLLDKLESEPAGHYVSYLIGSLKNYGESAVRKKIEDIMSRAPDPKAKNIEELLKSWK